MHRPRNLVIIGVIRLVPVGKRRVILLRAENLVCNGCYRLCGKKAKRVSLSRTGHLVSIRVYLGLC